VGKIHRYPIDCYRFYPDVGPVWADIMDSELLECYMTDNARWYDLVVIFRKK